MVQKLSTFLSTSLTEASLDSAGVRAIVQSETILLDSGTSGNYIKDIVGGTGIDVSTTGHAVSPTVSVDNTIATLAGNQTFTNKVINLSNNTLTTTLSQLSSGISGDDVVGVSATQTITNKTLTSPTINLPTITGPGSITNISTFGLRDTTTTSYQTKLTSNNASPILSADRTITLDVNNADRLIDLTGNLILGGNLTTSGGHATTLTTTGTTSVTLPTSGTLISKDGSEDFAITGTATVGALSTTGNITLDKHRLSSVSSTTTTTSQTNIATFTAASYGSAEVLIAAKRGSNRHITKLLIVHDGTNVSHTEYGTVDTGTNLATYNVDINGGNVRIRATPSSATSTVFNISLTLIDA
jgi:hypothetical protein